MIPFNNFQRHIELYGAEYRVVFEQFMESGWYVLGSEVAAFEKEFAAFCNCSYGIGVGSGTAALWLALFSLDIKPGDEVITVPNTAIPTVSAIIQSGAIPRFVDIDPDTYLMNVPQLESVITDRTKAVIPVHLFGQCADMDPLLDCAQKHCITVIEDCAQAHGAMYNGKIAGSMGDMGCFSYYPTKNLGAFGDAGMIVTNNKDYAEKLYKIRNYGQSEKYRCDIVGFNSRLDEVQAALLRAKMKYLRQWNRRRQKIAEIYHAELNDADCILPRTVTDREHVYHLYVIRVKNRETVINVCEKYGIILLIHYPIALHLQESFRFLGYKAGDFPESEKAASHIVSLPIYPELTDEEVKVVAQTVRLAVSP